ncbi:MAG: PD40 domain-containing protein [Roseiflexaceae bacterium]|nr:PD40 domain-containing protein [Roseiflexaceae bacterium]
MHLRRVLWGIITGLGLLALVGSGALAWALLRAPATSGSLLISDASTLRLGSGTNGQVLSAALRPASFRFPAVSPDGTRVVYVTTSGEGVSLVAHDLRSGSSIDLYTSSLAEPFNLTWSPDGRHVLFLAPGPGGLALLIVPADGSDQPVPVAVGQNIYFAWSDDSAQLVLHIDGHTLQNGRVALYRPGDRAATPFLEDPGFFQAPAFSRDGSNMFYVAQPPRVGERLTFAEFGASIVRVGIDGAGAQPIYFEPQAALRLVRSPSSDALAYVLQRIAENGSTTWQGLYLLDEAAAAPRLLSAADDGVDAFFWSPDGSQIAYLAQSRGSASRSARVWKVVQVASGEVREFSAFEPSAAFAELNVYFDAYQHGYSPWSPDGRRLAFAAEDGIHVIDLERGTSERISAGEMVMWVRN